MTPARRDARARINVLSEMPVEWRKRLSALEPAQQAPPGAQGRHPHPDRNDEYLLYQRCSAAWPLEPYSDEAYDEFVQRVLAYSRSHA